VSPRDWPRIPPGWLGNAALRAEYDRLRLKAQFDLGRDEARSGATQLPDLADDDSEKKLHDSLAALAASSIDRARDGAKFVETAAAALGTIYTGVLGLAFAASDKPLPGRGLYAAAFFGIAIVGAAYYLGFFQHIDAGGRVDYTPSRPENLWRRTEWLAAWTSRQTRTRAWAMRGAVLALAFGVAFMPSAFLPNKLFADPVVAVSAPDAEIVWPAPPRDIGNAALAAILYRAQLAEFTDSLHKTADAEPTGGVDTNLVLLILFVICVFLIGVGAKWDSIRNLRMRSAR
jgi:hypothetical protein